MNIFPFAGGAILQQLTGLMLVERTAAGYQTIWLFMLVCMVIATVAGFLSREKARAPATLPKVETQKRGQTN